MIRTHSHTYNSSKRFVLEVDLECAKELRELHNDYSLAPEKIEIKKNAVRLSIKDCWSLYISISNVKKLVSNFFDKEKYVIHYENL